MMDPTVFGNPSIVYICGHNLGRNYCELAVQFRLALIDLAIGFTVPFSNCNLFTVSSIW